MLWVEDLLVRPKSVCGKRLYGEGELVRGTVMIKIAVGIMYFEQGRRIVEQKFGDYRTCFKVSPILLSCRFTWLKF